MAKITVTRNVTAPLLDVWASWDNFGAIARFNPSLKASRLINGSAPSGTGATRQCDLADGKNYIRERIIGYFPQQKMVIDIYEGTMPLKKAVATITFRALAPNRTEVAMTMDFVPKMGLLGLLLVPMMKSSFRKMLTRLLSSNADYLEKGLVLNAA
jgi:ribosome-associated toxin RatA of RatAB toxin-antitoxin module